MKAILIVFIFVCLVTTIYSGYLLFANQTGPVVGSVLLAVGIIALIWTWSLTRRHMRKLNSGVIIIAILIIALFAGATGAYAGYEPLEGVKDQFADIFEGGEKTTQRDIYFIPPAGLFDNWKQGRLVTIKKWKGKDDKDISFSADKTPWVLNAGYEATSRISVKFDVQILKDILAIPDIQHSYLVYTRNGIKAITMDEKGKFTIRINASGCEWWIMVGTENN